MRNLRYWLRKVERATQETSDKMTLIDERNGQTYRVPTTAFIELLGVAADQGRSDDIDVDPEIADIMPTEDDPDKVYHLFLTNGSPFWWTKDQCYRLDTDEK